MTEKEWRKRALVYACARLQAEIVLQTARERETTQAVQKAE